MGLQIVSVDQFYRNNISVLLGHTDLMLAELTLPEIQVEILNRVKTKLTCADILINKHMYSESMLLESDAVYDLADIVEFIGLSETAESIRSAYANI